MNEFDDFTRIYAIVATTLNDTDRITLDEKYTVLKDKYNRLLNSLIQLVTSLDEVNFERNEFDQQNDHVQQLYHQLQTEFTKQKQQTPNDLNYPSTERRLEQLKQLLTYLNEINNHFKELTRLQRLLI